MVKKVLSRVLYTSNFFVRVTYTKDNFPFIKKEQMCPLSNVYHYLIINAVILSGGLATDYLSHTYLCTVPGNEKVRGCVINRRNFEVPT